VPGHAMSLSVASTPWGDLNFRFLYNLQVRA